MIILLNNIIIIHKISFPVKPCDNSPCHNNGTCENNEDSFTCTCAEGFKGDTCEEEGKVASWLMFTMD